MSLPEWLNAVFHSGASPYFPTTVPQLGQTVQLRLRVGHNAPIRRIFLRVYPDGEQAFILCQMAESTPACQWWTGPLPLHQPLEHYRFLIEAEDGLWWYNAHGFSESEPLDSDDFRVIVNYIPPHWVPSAVFYQIFPDRFADGDPSNNPRPEEYDYRGHRPRTFAWGTLPDKETSFSLVFYGGDLQGIAEKLPYLNERLGVNALYLNPVFTAYSNHKYDVIDYNNVDPHFGGNEALIALQEQLQRREMHYLLDIVPNHCGYGHTWFLQAQRDEVAESADYFTFYQRPDQYESWLGVWSLPKLNYASQNLRQKMYESADSVFQRWLKPPFSADGWRIDVANMLGRQGQTQISWEVLQGIRAAVKQANPQAYLLGENFFDASGQLQGNQLDGVMNYGGFQKPFLFWLTEQNHTAWAWYWSGRIISPVPFATTALLTTWRKRLSVIPWQKAMQQYNLLGSHDTPRIQTLVKGNTALHKLAAIVQFSYVGVPSIYYGDEIGMMDSAELEQRGCMVWDEGAWNQDLFTFYQKLIAFRQQSSALQTGALQFLASEIDSFAFLRESADQRVIVIACRKPRTAMPLPVAHGGISNGSHFVELFTGEVASVQHGYLALPNLPQGGTLWVEKKG